MTGAHTWKRWTPAEGESRWKCPPDHWTTWEGFVIQKGGVKTPRRFILICCPLCRCLGSLAHRVDAQGGVHPSIGCPHTGCKLHTIPNTLEGWSFGERPDTKDV